MTLSKSIRQWINTYLLSCSNILSRSSSPLDRSGCPILDSSGSYLSPSNSPIKNNNYNQNDYNINSEYDDKDIYYVVTSKGPTFNGNRHKLRRLIEETFKDFENVLTTNRG